MGSWSEAKEEMNKENGERIKVKRKRDEKTGWRGMMKRGEG